MKTARTKMWVVCFLSILLFGMGTSIHAGVRDPNLVGWWTFNEGSGTVAEDSGKGGHDGELFGNPEWSSEGVHGGSLLFDGVDDYVFIDGQFNFPFYTMGIWFRVDSPGQRDIISAYAVGVQHGILLELQAAGTLRYLHRFPLGTGGGSNFYTTDTYDDGAWYHAAMVKSEDRITLYVNGEVAGSTADNSSFSATDRFGVALGTLDNERSLARMFLGALDDLRIYDRVLSEAEVKALLKKGSFTLSADPAPEDTATDVPRDVTLTWTPGELAVTHDVYFGTIFEDVNEADRDAPMGVLISENQEAETLYLGRLDFGQSYYWRVDEVNGPANPGLYKGDVWSFTTELFAYPVVPNVATASSSFMPTMGAEKTIDGSGLDDMELHGVTGTDMWLTSATDTGPWIQYEFAKPQKLHEMLVWNSNQGIEPIIGFGCKSVTIETSMDGSTWTELADVPEFAQAPGAAGYAYNTTVAFGGVTAQYVRLTVNSGHGAMPQFGLSEVRFLAVPVYAREPQPILNAVLETTNVDLGWRSGRGAAAHEINIGTDPDNLVLVGTAENNTFAHVLDYGKQYYWRVDEVNEAETPARYGGDLWSFSTPPYAVVDDIELYEDEEFLEIWAFWADGYQDNSNGAIVGNGNIGERTIVFDGEQSMPIRYDNSGTSISEVTLEIDGQDWTASEIKSLSLRFYGATGNTGQLYVKINNNEVVYDRDPGDIAIAVWQAWNIDLTGLNGLQNVRSLTIGIKGAGASGVLYIDAVRLYPMAGELITPTEPDTANLVGHWMFDEGAGANAGDSSGNNNHGDVMGDAQWEASGKLGGALVFDGVDDIVVITQNSGLPIYNNGIDNAYSVTMWVKGGPQNDMRVFSEGSSTSNTPLVNLGTHNAANPTGQFASFIRPETGTTSNHPLSQAHPFDDTWHHIAWVDDNGTVAFYVDGRLDGGDFSYTRGTMDLNTTSIGGILRAAPSHFFTGQIDEVRVYSRALSAEEALWLAGGTGPIHKPF